MARKSTYFEVYFHLPKDGEEKKVLAKKIGKVHIKIIKEIVDNTIIDIDKKNKLITEIQKKIKKEL